MAIDGVHTGGRGPILDIWMKAMGYHWAELKLSAQIIGLNKAALLEGQAVPLIDSLSLIHI